MATPPPSRPCPSCGYDLAGLSINSQCPECGAARSCGACGYELAGLPPSAPCPKCGGVQAAARTARVCASCGYDLAGLAEGGKCPECGTIEITSSSRGLLVAASPAYLRTLHSGLTLMTWSMIIFVALRVFAFIASMPIGGTKTTREQLIATLGTMLLMVPTAMNFLGHMRYSTADPLLVPHEGRYAARRVIRFATWLLAPASLAMTSFAIVGVTIFAPASSPVAMGFLYAAEGVNVLGWLVQLSAVLSYSDIVARRAGDDRLAKRAREATYLYPLLIVTPVLLAAVGFVLPGLVCCVVPIACVVWLAVGVAYYCVLVDLGDRVRTIRIIQHATLVEQGLAKPEDRPPFN